MHYLAVRHLAKRRAKRRLPAMRNAVAMPRRLISCLLAASAVLGCQTAGAQAPPSNLPAISGPTAATPDAGGNCKDYSATATIDGEQHSISGRACKQADGTWRIAEGPPGSAQPQIAYWQPDGPGYIDDDPWLWGWPIGFSIGVPFFIDVHHGIRPFAQHGHFGHFVHATHFGGMHGVARMHSFSGMHSSGGMHGGFSHR
jgi:hypothetical protein